MANNPSDINNWPCMLSVAGSDSGAGAGIQADLKTGAALGVYVATAITAVTAQNTCRVSGVMPVSADMLHSQMLAVLEDFPIQAIKLGMLCRSELVAVVIELLGRYPHIPVVLDPVLVSSTGKPLLDKEGVRLLISELLPRVTLVTPNIREAAVITTLTEQQVIKQPADALKLIRNTGVDSVLLKGGHLPGDICEDLLLTDGQQYAFTEKRVDTKNTHGTGCTLSSAIAAGLASGMSCTDAVAKARGYITGALRSADQLGYGSGAGPLQHFFCGRAPDSGE